MQTIILATDAWRPQINGVVRTLEALAAHTPALGAEILFLTPEGFPGFPLPAYKSIRCALPTRAEIARRIEQANPDAIHIATEGPIGHAVRRFCLGRGLAFTTSFMTRFPEYISARLPIPETWSYAFLRRFHAPAAITMVSTQRLRTELEGRGFQHLGLWARGVDTALFHPRRALPLALKRPIFVTVGRIAIEKNLTAFLALDLPGSKLVIGEGPQEAELKALFPDAHFVGALHGDMLAGHMAAADVFVFPSRTDTFGLVQLEALASGVPVAAYPVPGPLDVIGDAPVGVLNQDLRQACLQALMVPRDACRAFAERHSWAASAAQFVGHCRPCASAPREAA
ncbi:MAG: glycosyltransferase family 1 protein [Alphaproteobacteria bacterium]|nr:glycosyltransferase family 1 protein [Alphaproteobacteria bacterium]